MVEKRFLTFFFTKALLRSILMIPQEHVRAAARILQQQYKFDLAKEVKSELWGDAAKALSEYVTFCMTLPDSGAVAEPGPEITAVTEAGQASDKKQWTTGQKVAVGLGIGAGVLAAGAIGTGIAVAVSKNKEDKAKEEKKDGKARSADTKKDDDEDGKGKKDDKKEKKEKKDSGDEKKEKKDKKKDSGDEKKEKKDKKDKK